MITINAQRPGYLSGPVGYPGLANRFKDDSATTTALDLNNRIGEQDGTTIKIPIDARGDVDLVNRLNDWPRENRPFWFINAEHIENHRNPQRNTQQPSLQDRSDTQQNVDVLVNPESTRTIRPAQTRSSFAGSL